LAHAPCLAPLLEGGVVQVAVVGQQPHRTAFLLAGRVGAELVSAFHGMPLVGRVVCSAMYRRIVASDTRPTDATKYDLDHKVGSRERRWPNSARNARLVAPLSWWARPYSLSDSIGTVYTHRVSNHTHHRTRFPYRMNPAVPRKGFDGTDKRHTPTWFRDEAPPSGLHRRPPVPAGQLPQGRLVPTAA